MDGERAFIPDSISKQCELSHCNTSESSMHKFGTTSKPEEPEGG